jgi:hypothetical protein
MYTPNNKFLKVGWSPRFGPFLSSLRDFTINYSYENNAVNALDFEQIWLSKCSA